MEFAEGFVSSVCVPKDSSEEDLTEHLNLLYPRNISTTFLHQAVQ